MKSKQSLLRGFLDFFKDTRPIIKVGQTWEETTAHRDPFERKTYRLEITDKKEGYVQFRKYNVGFAGEHKSWKEDVLHRLAKLIKDVD